MELEEPHAVSDIKKKRSSIMDFRIQTKEMGVVRTVKTMKLGEDPTLDQAVFQTKES